LLLQFCGEGCREEDEEEVEGDFPSGGMPIILTPRSREIESDEEEEEEEKEKDEAIEELQVTED
jgi:hypothetical protein